MRPRRVGLGERARALGDGAALRASMRPRRVGLGEALDGLQGRVTITSFNEAEARRPRRELHRIEHVSASSLLQ